MGKQPRAALGRRERAPSHRIRRWLVMAGRQAKTLLRSSEAAETVLREVLEMLGEEGAAELTVGEAERRLEAVGERLASRPESGEPELMANVGVLSRLLGLEEVEEEVLALFAAIPTNPGLQQVLERIDVRSKHQAVRALAAVLGYRSEEVARALRTDGALARFHVLNVSGGAFDFSQLSLMNEELERAPSSASADEESLLSGFFTRAAKGELTRDDYAHLEPRVGTLIAYLRGADAGGDRGINVLFYGVPGTGKPELARLVADELGWVAYEVRTENRDGTPSSGDERMASLMLAQRFLESSHRRLVIFDELEDLVSSEYGFSRARIGKLFMHRMLEKNAVPTIWIANDIDALSLAVRRRFDLSIPFGPLPGVARRKVLERHLGGMEIDDETRAQLLRRESLLPAQVAAGRKVERLAGERGAQGAALLAAVDASMRLLGQPIPSRAEALAFDVTLCNADTDLELAVRGLAADEARHVVALYGPPGVGKSACAGWLAEQLGQRAVRIGASDLLSAFLGETEERVARLLEAVDVKSELIVLEEADELLAARNAGRQSWEVRLANELLMRMDAFAGTVVLTTNALERMDVAALRRCDLKIRLDYLRYEQRLAMWRRQTGTEAGEKAKDRLRTFYRVTAGDFVVVAAQARIVGKHWTAEDWLDALQNEMALRPPVPGPVGFAA